MPRDNYFKAAFVFGQKAVDAVNNSAISEEIKENWLLLKFMRKARASGWM
ncbi:MAG: hypothetical protein J0L56_14440 [Chitinophagales bacterium]|nr:hypothetical protein [Chitinophagales bacterium]